MISIAFVSGCSWLVLPDIDFDVSFDCMVSAARECVHLVLAARMLRCPDVIADMLAPMITPRFYAVGNMELEVHLVLAARMLRCLDVIADMFSST